MGTLAQLTPSRLTLDQLATDWLLGPGSELAESSLRTYTAVIRKHVVARIGRYPVAAIDRSLVTGWMAQMKRDGVSPDARARALKYLRMLLTFGVDHGYLTINPATGVKMPKVPASDPVRPLSPRQVEAICAAMMAQGRRVDVVQVRLMAYAGLRPGEVPMLRWMDVGERSLSVRAGKTNTVKPVKLIDPLAVDLKRWRMECGRPGDRSLVIARPQVGSWRLTTYGNWRSRVFDPACEVAGVSATPKSLRHGFASLLIHAHYPVTYVAQQMRHSVEMTTRHYAHVIEDLDPEVKIDPEQAIREAQGEHRGHLTNTA